MTLDPREAAHALSEIESAKEKSSALRGYAIAGNYLIVWGAAWLVGGGASAISEDAGRTGWTVAVLSGAAASVVLGLRERRTIGGSRASFGKVFATVGVVIALSAALSLVLDVSSMREGTALQALLVAAAYMAFGIWRGARMLALGAALAVSVLFAWFYLGAGFEAFVGVVGGAMLMLSGLWLRKA